jgi:general secretion pathway protein K
MGTGSYQKQGPGFLQNTGDAAKFLGGGAVPAGFGTEISALRINITVHEGRTEFRLSTVIAPPGGATTVQDKAISTSLTDNTNNSTSPATTANSSTSNSSSSSSTPASTSDEKKLNYPFTLLEISENAEIPAALVPQPKA